MIQLHVRKLTNMKIWVATKVTVYGLRSGNKSSWDILECVFQLPSCVHNYNHAATIFPLPIVMTRHNQSLSRFTCTSTTFQIICKLISWTYPTTANAKMRPATSSDILDQCCLLFPSQPLCYLHVKCLSSSQTIKRKSDDTFASGWLWWKLLLIANRTIPIQQASSSGKVCSPIVGTPNPKQENLAIGLNQELAHPVFVYDESRKWSFEVPSQ